MMEICSCNFILRVILVTASLIVIVNCWYWLYIGPLVAHHKALIKSECVLQNREVEKNLATREWKIVKEVDMTEKQYKCATSVSKHYGIDLSLLGFYDKFEVNDTVVCWYKITRAKTSTFIYGFWVSDPYVFYYWFWLIPLALSLILIPVLKIDYSSIFNPPSSDVNDIELASNRSRTRSRSRSRTRSRTKSRN